MSRPSDSVRRVRPDDVPRICQLVRDLAEYERAPTEAQMTDDQLHEALFGTEVSLYGHVAEVDRNVIGFALWFRNFSTWRGRHGIYVEDLYVTPEHRGSGVGKSLLAALARECVARGYPRLDWWVLNWNEPSIAFYRALGAVPMDEWTVFRLTDQALADLAGSGWHSAALEEGQLPSGGEQQIEHGGPGGEHG
ncbi:MAG: GNAT family N-acetyltransferase [Actinomycetota bacterium]|nr:GNAT family N-acetyltransferase [Actinomycetota bacterium]